MSILEKRNNKIYYWIILFIISISNQLFAQNIIEHFNIQSQYLKETKIVNVALPDQYQFSAKEYPIILILDSNLLFDTTTAIANQLSRTSRMPESIVISFSAGSRHRNYYAPNLYNNHRDRPYNYGNKQDELLSFLENELLPQIEQKYRVAKFKIVVGFSPSSALSIHTLLTMPNLFQAYICLAAGNIIGDGYSRGKRLIEELEKLYGSQKLAQNYLYVVSGSKDAEGQPYIKASVEDFNDKLFKYNTSNIHTKAEIIEGEGHTDVVLPGLISAFDFIFPKGEWVVDYLDLIEDEGTAKENIMEFYNDLSKIYGFQIYPNVDRLYSMSCLKNLGRRLLGTNKTEEAIELFELWTTLYPQSHLAYHYLGTSYKENSNLIEAGEAYNKALNLALAQNSNDTDLYKKSLESLNQIKQ